MAVRLLPDYLQEVAKNELNEVPSRVPEDIKAIKEWIAKQPHINACTDDQWILLFLRGCKFRLQTVKEKMEEFYLLRTLLPDYFENRDPLLPDIQEFLNHRIVLPLPLNKEGPQTFILRVSEGDVDTVSLKTILKGGTMFLDMIMRENDHLVLGQYLILDMKHFDIGYITQLTPFMIKMIARALRNAYPTRPKGFFILNSSPMFKALVEFGCRFLNKKLTSRIHFYDKDALDELKKVIPTEILPREYGGVGDSCEKIGAEWKTKMEDYREWFLESSQYKVDMSKKVNHLHTEEETVGSFRKLEID
ncbi:hypothetical protein RI129_013274 [Pyrocoelia pectoralis]|uniref:CRAL-TRIO domain-containing protein n=1 Tax=Pyrocoelia pectoralis TaxID=417401 RepID=A0AAN7V2Q7_9COLE